MSSDLDLANISADDDLKVGALADGFASTAVKTDIDDSAVGLGNASDSNIGNGSNNDSSSNSSDNSTHESNDNGNNRGNDYDYDLRVTTNTSNTTNTSTDDHTNTVSINDPSRSYNTDDSNNTDSSSHIKDSFNSDSSTHTTDSGNAYSYADSSSHVTDSGNSFSYADSSTHTKDSFNSDSSTHYDLGNLKDVGNSGSIGIAGGDLNFHLGDDYSFNLNLDNVLNNALNGAGNDVGFSPVQANNLADQDQAYNITMNNQHASSAVDTGGADHGSSGFDFSFDPHGHQQASGGTDISAQHDQSIDASSVAYNAGFHQEIVQGANLVSNTADISYTGGDHHDTTSSS